MRYAPSVALLLVVLFGTMACDELAAPNRGRAMAMADNYLLNRGWDWGPVQKAWPPDPDHTIYRHWWQIDYHGPTHDERPAVVLVDAWNGWARLPPADYPLRIDAAEAGVERQPPIRVEPGSWIYVLDTRPAGELEGLAAAATADELNERARRDGLPPLFDLRPLRSGERQIIYGWDGKRGILRDGSIAAWVQRQHAFPDARWSNLLGD